MAGRSQQSFQKRQREKNKQDKQAAKRARREERKEARDGDEETEGRGEMEIMEDYRVLSERYNNGEIEDEEYEERKEELFEELGLAIQ